MKGGNRVYIITAMRESHLAEIFEIEKTASVTPWSLDALKKELEVNKLAVYLSALHGKEVVGYAGMWHVVNEGHITNIAVKESHRRKGVGTLIVNALIETARRKEMMGLTLEVRVSNTAARSMYEKLGFVSEGLRKEYYADTKEDAVIMWKYLD